MKKIHISIDDVSASIKHIADSKYHFFECDFGKWLIKLHIKYGCKLSLYIQDWEWMTCTDTTMFQGIEGEWLRLGIHTARDGRDFGELSYVEAKSEWETFCNTVMEHGGKNNTIDSFPRLHKFAGAKEALLGMQGANISPATGFLTADDSRQSYYLNEDNISSCPHGFMTDELTGLFFLPTNLRLDWFKHDFRSDYEYFKPKTYFPYHELNYCYKNGKFSEENIICVFTHEWQIYRRKHMTVRKKWIEDVCRYVVDNDAEYVFPMDEVRPYLNVNVSNGGNYARANYGR